MCCGVKIFCMICRKYIMTCGDTEDSDYGFDCCDDYDICRSEDFKNIDYMHYFNDWCKQCLKKGKHLKKSKKKSKPVKRMKNKKL